MIEKLARILTRKPVVVAVIAAAMLLPSVLGMAATRINYDILTYLPEELESVQGERLLEEPFQMAATSMLIVEGMPAAYSSELINEIKQIDGVSNAVGFSNIVGAQIPVDMIPAEYRDMLFSGDATMMIVQYSYPGASDETMNAIDQVRALCNAKCFLAGFSVVIKDTKELIDQQLPIFVSLAVVMAFAAMMLTMESTVLPIMLLLNIGMAVLYNFGTNIFLGEISYITQAIAAVLQLGVTMDYSIFLYRRYIEERHNYSDKRDAMAKAVEAAFASLTGSSLTTIAGFLALCAMRLTLGRDIGIVMAKGVVLGVATVILVLPSMLLLCDGLIAKHRHKTILPKSFDGLNSWIIRHRKAIAIIAVLLFIPSLYAEKNATLYYKLDTSLPGTLPSIVANNKLRDEFGMTNEHFVVLSDGLNASQMNAMESRIREVPGVTDIISSNSLLGTGLPSFFIPDEVRSMLKQGGYQLMVINSSYGTATDEMSGQIEALSSIIKEYDPQAKMTGEAVMSNDLIEVTNVDFKVTNYLSIAAIAIIVAVVFRSVSVPAILVLAIELAIMINQGIPYFTGSEVAFVTPTVISCVQLGSTVDYAILISSRFQEELKKGEDRLEAARIAGEASDASIITSALVMFCATMGVAVVCSIDIISSMCLMLARGAIISAIVCIFVIPAVLCICEPLFAHTSLHWKDDGHVKARKTKAGAAAPAEA